MTLTALEIREVLAFDRFRTREYTTGQRITIHQHIGQRAPLPPELEHRIMQDHKKIVDSNWICPEYKYNDDRELVYFNDKTKTFLTL